MQQFCPYGSVRGAPGNRRPYRDKTTLHMNSLSAPCDKVGFLPLVLSRLRGRLQRGSRLLKTFSAACWRSKFTKQSHFALNRNWDLIACGGGRFEFPEFGMFSLIS